MLLLALAACDPDKIPVDSAAPPDVDTGDWVEGDPAQLCQVAMTCPDGIEDEPKRPCSFTITSGDGGTVYDAMARVEIRGRSSAAFPKPPYAVELHAAVSHLVAPHATWRYRDGASPPPDGWTDPGYDDAAWASGAAPLGYGDDPATTLDYGQDEGAKPPAAWFRATFDVADPAAVAELELELVRDDGAIVWLNGVEVVRSNLAADAGAGDLATAQVQEEFEEVWTDWEIDPSLLVAGTNTLAVEVHQADRASSDLRFDLALTASTGGLGRDLFGMGGEDDWVLGSAYIDRVLWRNKLAYDTFQSFGGKERWAAEQVFCELTRDGEYEGVYLLGESPRRDGDRVDLTEDDGTGASFLVKLSDELGFRTSTVSQDGEWRAVYPSQDEAHADALDGVDAALAAWEADVLTADEAMWDHLDLESAVDWVIVQELFKNSDAYYLSVHLWRDAGGPMHFTPWDLDLSLGYPYTDCGATGFVWRTHIPEAFSASPAFRERLLTRWAELRQDTLSDDALFARIAAYEATMGDAIGRNFERWPVDEIAFGWGGEDNWLCPAETYEEEHTRVMAWIPERTAWLDAHLNEY